MSNNENPLVDSVLDEIIHKIAQNSLEVIDNIIPNISNELRVQYIGRAFAEVLAVIVASAPADQVLPTCESLCSFIKLSVSHNLSIESVLSKAFDKKIESSLSSRMNDSFLLASKADA